MRFKSLIRYRNLIIALSVLIVLLALHVFLGNLISSAWETAIQGQKINALHILDTLMWFVIAWISVIVVDLTIWEGIVRKRTGHPVPQLLRQAVSLLIFVIIFMLILTFVYNKSITGLVATTGAAGLVIGFALRGVIENAFQGIALNIEQPIKTGDVITIPGKIDDLAEVKDITYRNTYLHDFYGRVLAIPNSVVCSNVIRNFSRSRPKPIFCVAFSVKIGVRGLSAAEALRIITAVVTTHEFVAKDPAPNVVIATILSSEIEYDVGCWAYREKVSPSYARHFLNVRILEQLNAAGYIVGNPYIDYEGIEKQIATVLHEVDDFNHLESEEKTLFYQQQKMNKRSILVLNQVSIFANLNEEEITALSSAINTVNYKKDDVIIKQGDEDDVMYILVQGVLQVLVKSPEQKEAIPVAQLLPGQYFGEMSLLVGEPRSATVVALSDALVYAISKETMSELFEQHPEMIDKISDKIAEQQMINELKKREFSSSEVKTQKHNFATAFVKRIKKFFGKSPS